MVTSSSNMMEVRLKPMIFGRGARRARRPVSHMITSLSIDNLRGVRSGRLDELTALTVLAGGNGCGKSTIVDALLIAAHPELERGLAQALTRHPASINELRWLFGAQDMGAPRRASIEITRTEAPERYRWTLCWPGGEPTLSCDIVSVDAGDREHGLLSGNVSVLPDGSLAAVWAGTAFAQCAMNLIEPAMPPAFAAAYSEAVRQGKKREVLELMRAVAPAMDGMEILTELDGRARLYLTSDHGAVPACLAGGGVQSFLQLALHAAAQPSGLLVVEEPEARQHPGTIAQTAKVLLSAMRRGVQVVVTTRSRDLVTSLASEADEADRERMALFMLALDQGVLSARRHAGSGDGDGGSDGESDWNSAFSPAAIAARAE